MSLNSPGPPLRLSNLATTPSPRRSNRSTPSPPIQRRRRRTARTSIFNNSPMTTPTSPASPLPEFNGSPIFTTSGQSPILTTEYGLINTPPPSPPRLTRSGPARRINFNLPPYNLTRKSRRSTNNESHLSRENLRELQRRRRQLVANGTRAPHNLASNFDPTIPVVRAQPVVHPVNMQYAHPVVTLENHYAPLANATGKNVSNTVLPAKIVNEIRKKRKERKTKRLNNMLKKMLSRKSRKRYGGTKKRNNKNKRNTKKNRRNNRKK